MFDPSLIGNTQSRGVQHLVLSAVAKCDRELRHRLYDSVYLSGGSCNMGHFAARLLNELRKRSDAAQAPGSRPKHSNVKNWRIRKDIAPTFGKAKPGKNRHLTAFVGGTLIASNSAFRPLFITRHEFEEFGASILFRRSLC